VIVLDVLLSYLVPSRARRRLLRLLWAEEAEGSVSGLARRAGVCFAAAHRELAAMRAEGAARAERSGADLVYRANPGYRPAVLVRRLLREDAGPSGPPPAAECEMVRGWLAAAGAPLLVSRRSGGRVPPLEEVLAAGLAVSHHDATVARVLPLVFWRHRDQLDHGRLVRAATRRHERQALGFFLELTGLLAEDPRLASLSEPLRDRRRTRPRPFFARAQGRMALALARRRTPALARKWGYLINMDLDSFASAFGKHGEAA
jgi:hypothetical protein